MGKMTKVELQARNRELQSKMAELNDKAYKESREFTEDEQREWNALSREKLLNEGELRSMLTERELAKFEEHKNKGEMFREMLRECKDSGKAREILLTSGTNSSGTSNTTANVNASGAIELTIHEMIPTLHEGLELPESLRVVTGVTGNEVWPVSVNDVEMEEVGEIEAINEQALDFTNIKVQSRRVSLSVGISNKAIDNAAFDIVGFVLYKVAKAWEIYFAKKNYSHAAWTGNKGAFSEVTPETVTFDNNIGAVIDEKFGEIAELGFDDLGVVVLSPRMEAKLKHTFEGNGVAAHAIIENGLCCGHPYVSTKHINYKLNGSNKYVKDTDEYIGIGLFQYLPIQQHGLVRQTVDATSAAVAKANKTVVCFSTEISITELSRLVNGNKSGKPQAFKLLKVQFPSES